jgi:oligopeptide/dipeptide ABC transporter ATP-binding protein
MTLLAVRSLRTSFFVAGGEVRAVDGVDVTIGGGETIGLVGESGCGKTVLALSIIRLVPDPPGRIVGGSIFFRDTDLLALDKESMRKIRGNEISMIFQEPMTSLNPVFTIGDQIDEVIRLHQGLDRREAREKTIEMLDLVGIPDPERRAGGYPHQLSGGMRQRVMIAMALACEPGLLIADEPTTALDVTIQAQILDLIESLKKRIGMSVLIITHDLGVIAEISQKVSVMYAGRIVEHAPVRDLFHSPLHPYTIGLMTSLPRLDERRVAGRRLPTIPGMVPDLRMMPRGCPFEPRCDRAQRHCIDEPPKLDEIRPGHWVSCWEAKA